MKIVYLTPESNIRTILRSDTLWGTICWGIRYIYGNKALKDFIESYINSKPEFIISSTFPFCKQEDSITEFFPRPLIPLTFSNDNDYQKREEKIIKAKERKKLKSIKYLPKDDFIKIIIGQFSLLEVLDQLVQKGTEIKTPSLKSISMTHNTIDRLKNGTLELNGVGQLFHSEDLFFTPSDEFSSGLYFLAEGDTTKLDAVLRLFTHIGLGGDRNIGKGYYTYDIKDYNLIEPSEFKQALTIDSAIS